MDVRDEIIVTAVFFYGLFMDQDVLKEMGYNPQNVRLAHLMDYRLVIGDKATLVPCEGACTYGTVIDLEHREVEALYSSDGVVDYVARKVLVGTDADDPIAVISYVLPRDKVSGRNRSYVHKLVSIAMQLHLPESYIKEIESWC